jgi:hypothetical protein
MNQLDKTEKKVVVMMIGGIALLIAFSFVWDNYQEYQRRESGRKTCEKLAVQLGVVLNCDCKEIRKIQDDMLAKLDRGEEVSQPDLVGAGMLSAFAFCDKQRN